SREAVELGGEAEVVHLARPPGGLAGEERARAVRRVAVDRAAGVADDQRALRDRRVSRLRVRPRAVLAGGDDGGERRAVGSGLVPRLLDPPGELGLRPADE